MIYDLRHTFATRFVEAGGDLVTLKDILGHSSLRSVIKYVHPTAQHQRERNETLRSVQAGSLPQDGEGMMMAQKLQVGRARNRTRPISHLFATYLEVCKTFIRRFDPAPRLHQLAQKQGFSGFRKFSL